MELRRDFGYFISFVDSFGDRYFGFGGGEKFGGGMHFGFGFDSYFVVVERFGDGHLEEEEVFGNCCFEEVVGFVKRRRSTECFV